MWGRVTAASRQVRDRAAKLGIAAIAGLLAGVALAGSASAAAPSQRVTYVSFKAEASNGYH